MIARQIKENILANLKFKPENAIGRGTVIFKLKTQLLIEIALVPIIVIIILTNVEIESRAVIFQIFVILNIFIAMFLPVLTGLLLPAVFFGTTEKDRSSKLIFTKPCSPEIWLFSTIITI